MVVFKKMNKNKNNSPVWQHNTCYSNIIAIEDVILLVQNYKDNERLLAIKNIDKIAIPKLRKVITAINFEGKNS